MKNLLISISLVVIGQIVVAQKTDRKNDTGVYQQLISESKIDSNYTIYFKTSLDVLRMYDFKHADLNKWEDKGIIEEGYNTFANSIDVDKLSEYILKNKIGEHRFTKDMHESKPNLMPIGCLVFSPIIYSADKTVAICSMQHIFGRDDSSGYLFLLAMKDGHWKIIRSYTLFRS